MEFPELRPEIFLQWMQCWIARNNRATKLPFAGMLDQIFLLRVVDDVEADLCEGIAFALFVSQDVIVGLMLELMRTQLWAEMFPQKLHPILLVRVTSHSHPDQMNMIRHQAIGRAEESSRAAAWSMTSRKCAWKVSFSQPVPRMAMGMVQWMTESAW